MGSVLFVCKANVCRSPVMSFVFSTALSESHPVAVHSRGTKAVLDGQMCAIGRRVIGSKERADQFTARHRAAQVDAALVDSQDLILVASREERAFLARLCPARRQRVFTLREALELSRVPLTKADRSWLEGFSGHSSWALYSSLLDRRRGTVNLDATPARFPWSRRREQFDIPDAHQRGVREHTAVITGLVSTVNEFVARTVSLLDEVSATVVR